MSEQELAAIVARDAEWGPTQDVEDDSTMPQEFRDRRALLVLLRETREALLFIDYLWDATGRYGTDPVSSLFGEDDPIQEDIDKFRTMLPVFAALAVP